MSRNLKIDTKDYLKQVTISKEKEHVNGSLNPHEKKAPEFLSAKKVKQETLSTRKRSKMKRTRKALLTTKKIYPFRPQKQVKENAEMSPATGAVQNAESSNVLMETNENKEALSNEKLKISLPHVLS